MAPNKPGSLQGIARAVLDFVGQSPLLTTVFLFLFSAAVNLALMGFLIRWLQGRTWRKDAATWSVREDTPDTHQVKQGTPSMGGIGIIGLSLGLYLSFNLLLLSAVVASRGQRVTWLMIAGVLLLAPSFVFFHALLGFIDDWSKATGRGGLRARVKLFWQILLAVLFLFLLQRALLSWQPNSIKADFLNVGSIGTCVFLMIATCNAANLTDGVDGLAAGLGTIALLSLCLVLRDTTGFQIIASWVSAALAGGFFGFLWFNRHPARIFMGDTGSLALGAGVAIVAIMMQAVFLLPFICFVFYAEAASVTLQVLWFKWTKRQTGEGKRLFRRAPLHHHFELGGWSEWRVVGTFWLVNLITTALGLTLWFQGVLPRWP